MAESSISERNERAHVTAVRPGRPHMFVVFTESLVLPFSVPFLNSPCSLIFPVLESVSFVSSGSCYIPSISCCSNINFAFFGFFNCSFSMFELISNCVFRRLQFELCNHCPIHPFFLLFKPVLDCLLCLLCLTAWVFTIIQPIGWEFGVLADPILEGCLPWF